jgi:hypothetical protein
VLPDKAYSAKANRGYLRRRRIKATIPEKDDQAANRRKKGPNGGRPPRCDSQLYKQRHAVECGINQLKQHWAGGHLGSTSSPCATKSPSTSPRSTSGSVTWNDM